MQRQLTTRDGNTIPLTEEIYEAIVQLVKKQPDFVEPASSIDELEGEFVELLADSASTDDLLAEHAHERSREEHKLEQF